MLKSMTGFGAGETESADFGKISVEIRSTNHKFLEIVLHLPEGFLSLEEKLRKLIEAKIRRGRITCAVNLAAGTKEGARINEKMLKNYLSALGRIQTRYKLKNQVALDTLIHLPGVLSLEGAEINKALIWPKIKIALDKAVGSLLNTRLREGRAMESLLRKYSGNLRNILQEVKARFKKAVSIKARRLKTDEERNAFLKNSDITEEIERLEFHAKNFMRKIAKDGVIGKELDFIAQEMQREANTMGAKSFDKVVSSKVVQMKSLVEKIREQAQNIE